MYRLIIKDSESGYTAKVQKRMWKMWLTFHSEDFPTKRECKQFYKAIVK